MPGSLVPLASDDRSVTGVFLGDDGSAPRVVRVARWTRDSIPTAGVALPMHRAKVNGRSGAVLPFGQQNLFLGDDGSSCLLGAFNFGSLFKLPQIKLPAIRMNLAKPFQRMEQAVRRGGQSIERGVRNAGRTVERAHRNAGKAIERTARQGAEAYLQSVTAPLTAALPLAQNVMSSLMPGQQPSSTMPAEEIPAEEYPGTTQPAEDYYPGEPVTEQVAQYPEEYPAEQYYDDPIGVEEYY